MTKVQVIKEKGIKSNDQNSSHKGESAKGERRKLQIPNPKETKLNDQSSSHKGESTKGERRK